MHSSLRIIRMETMCPSLGEFVISSLTSDEINDYGQVLEVCIVIMIVCSKIYHLYAGAHIPRASSLV